jgi:hypothetical protein
MESVRERMGAMASMKECLCESGVRAQSWLVCTFNESMALLTDLRGQQTGKRAEWARFGPR